MQIDQELERRWLGKGRIYRKLLEEKFPLDHIEKFQIILNRFQGKQLPQRLKHKKISGIFKGLK